jgi:ATP-binding cassette subfamily F protein 2
MGRSAKAAAKQKQTKAAASRTSKSAGDDAASMVSSMSLTDANSAYSSTADMNGVLAEEQPSMDEILSKHVARTCTGVLASVATARDVKIEQFSMQFHGQKLIDNTTLELTFGRRYGLLGANGSGKSTFLEVRFRAHKVRVLTRLGRRCP